MAEKITIRVAFGQSAVSLGIIGRVGENISRQLLFDCSSVLTGRTDASIICVVKRPKDTEPYTAALSQVGDTDVYKLVLTSAEVAFAGSVQFELRMLDGEEILKAAIYTGTVESAMTSTADAPGATIPDALNRIDAAVEKAENMSVAVDTAYEAAAAANAAAEAAEEAAAPPIIRAAEGAGAVYVADSADREPVELVIYGRTEQQSTPAPTAPATFVSTARSGTLVISSRASLTDTEGQTSANVQVVDGLSGMPVNGGGNYIDGSQRWLGDELDCKRGVIVRRLAKKTLTGTEDISHLDSWGEGTYRIYCGDAVDIGTVETLYGVMCTHAPATWATTVAKGSIGAGRAGRFVLLNLGAEYNTVDLFKDYLAEQNEAGTPVEVLYELGTPVEEQLTASGLTIMLMTRMRKGGTAIVNDATAYMKLEYIADTKTYIDDAAEAVDSKVDAVSEKVSGISAKMDDINEKVDSVKLDAVVDRLVGVDTELAERLQIATDSTCTWLDRAEMTSSYGLASSRRWFLAHDVPAGATIDSLAWYNMQTEGTPTVQVEVWERVGNKLQKVWSKSIETDAKQTYTVEIGYKTRHAAMVGMLPSTNSIGFSSSVAGQWLMVTKPVTADEPYLDPDLTELDTADVVSFGDGYIANATLTYTRKYGVIVPIGLGQEYETIQDAIDSIKDDSADNPYTLLLMPSATPYSRFSLQRKLDEERPTRRVPRWISIVGIDKARTIVQSDTGEYESPPAEVVTNGLLKNIIFRMTNDCPDATPAKGGYAVHFDCNTPDNVGFDLLVEDCDFESATGPGVGIGVHENERLVFRHCRFYNTASAAYKPNSDYKNLADYGCAFAHTSLRADAQNMRITFEGCVGVCKEGTKSLWLGDAGEYTKEKCWFEYTLINNTFWNEATGTPAYYIKDALYANAMNHGNNTEDGYKLIESITLDEDVQTVVRTAAPDGTPYNLDSVYIKLTSPAYSETRMVWFAVGSTDATDIWTEDKLVYHGENMAINTDGETTELLVESVHGVYRGLSIKPTNKAVSITANAGLVQATARKIKAVRVFAFSNTTNNLLPSGTTIEIWGCKA